MRTIISGNSLKSWRNILIFLKVAFGGRLSSFSRQRLILQLHKRHPLTEGNSLEILEKEFNISAAMSQPLSHLDVTETPEKEFPDTFSLFRRKSEEVSWDHSGLGTT